ncbi:MAG: hypothetical protein Fur0027_14590 [Raineya sp.]
MQELSKNTNPSPEELQAWEAKYGKLKKVVLKAEEGEDMVFYFKKIDLKTLRLAQNAITQEKDSIKYAEIVLKNSVINGSAYLEDSEVFLGLLPIVDKLLTSRVAVLEKN